MAPSNYAMRVLNSLFTIFSESETCPKISISSFKQMKKLLTNSITL